VYDERSPVEGECDHETPSGIPGGVSVLWQWSQLVSLSILRLRVRILTVENLHRPFKLLIGDFGCACNPSS
jgi:hypothetical protein